MTNLVEVHYQYQDEDIPVSPNLNIFVACFTTCGARLRLYAALETAGGTCPLLRHGLRHLLDRRESSNPGLGRLPRRVYE